MKNYNTNIKIENIIWSIVLLILFFISVNYQYNKTVVSIFAYLFLVSICPIFLNLFFIISHNVNINNVECYEKYVVNIKKIKFNWSRCSNKFSKNNIFFKKINNTFFINQPSSMCYIFIDNVLKNYSLKFALIDYNGIEFFGKAYKENLLCKVFTNKDDIKMFLEKIIQLIDHRYELFVKKNVKNYLDYNKISRDLKELLIVVNDADEIINDINLKNYLIRILMHSKDVGIKLIMFSNKDSLDLQHFDGLIKITREFENFY